jgi:threonine aldolase
MRAAMAAAEVGDDVYGEDPTVNRLEARAAEIFGRESALFVPTGTMGNQIAIRLHTEHGQEVICEARSHVLDWEMAMMSAFSGCLPRAIHGEHGILTWEQISAVMVRPSYYRASTGLLCLESSHNMAGGTVTPLAIFEEIWHGAKEAGLATHLDGARIFNSAVALGLPVAKLTRGFDTVNFCLSKGLGAPVGSMLVGSAAAMHRARIFRKALGGGMRQAGVLAAAGILALEQGPSRLHEDHANAQHLAQAVATCRSVAIDLATVQTNIVRFDVKGLDAVHVVAELKAQGVLCSSLGRKSIRLVTHRDVSRAQCETAAATLVRALHG